MSDLLSLIVFEYRLIMTPIDITKFFASTALHSVRDLLTCNFREGLSRIKNMLFTFSQLHEESEFELLSLGVFEQNFAIPSEYKIISIGSFDCANEQIPEFAYDGASNV